MKNNNVATLRQRLAVGRETLLRYNERTFRITKKTAGEATGKLFTYIMLCALATIFITPFVYLLTRSVMSPVDLADSFNVIWVPRSLDYAIRNYVAAYELLNYLPRLAYSLMIAGIATLMQIVTCSFVAYGFARIRFAGNKLLFGLVLFSLIIPPQTIIVTQFLMFSRVDIMGFKVVDSAIPFILPCLFSLGLNGGLFVFLFRQTFRGMPKELENAAMIDGTGIFGAYFRVMLPNAISTVLVSSVLSLIWQWNNYFEPGIYIRSVDRYTLTMMLKDLGTTAFTEGVSNFNKGVNLAATTLCALPVILIFFLLQKRFMKGIETTGLAN